MTPVIHWFRRDLRLTDNSALDNAFSTNAPVIPLFIFDPHILKSKRSGTPRMAFLLKALHALDTGLREYNSRLLIRFGEPTQVLRDLIEETGAASVYYNKDYSPGALKRDEEVKHTLSIPVYEEDDLLLLPPGAVLKDDGNPYTVFSPFKKRWLTIPKLALLEQRTGYFHQLENIEGKSIPTLHELGFSSTIQVPEASEKHAQHMLDAFTSKAIFDYKQGRERLVSDFAHEGEHGTSFLSPYLHLGLLSPRQAYWAARDTYHGAPNNTSKESIETWVSELIWRDFYNHILYHFPHVQNANFRTDYNRLEWREAQDELDAWKAGNTGYPVVDAAMRQMNGIGWMHNRARMIVAIFLCKDLLIDWREGELYFMQQLIDGDTAANNGGWQWSAGTGTDAQPYFRIFNPVSQSQKFDPDGVYIKRWVPELRDVPIESIHMPWEMPVPPVNYPKRIVDHDFARHRTLEAFAKIK